MAIIEARNLIGPVHKSQAGNRNKGYADGDDILDAIEEAMFTCKLSPYSKRIDKPEGAWFKTEIVHGPTGQKRCEIRKFEPDSSGSLKGPQAEKSAETYYRRMGLINLLCLRSGETKETTSKELPKPVYNDKVLIEIDRMIELKGEVGEEAALTTCKKYKKSTIEYLNKAEREELLVILQHL